jgi:hypothetical protein
MAEVAAEASGEQAASEAAMSGCGADEGGGGCSVQTRHRKAGGMAGRQVAARSGSDTQGESTCSCS